MRVPHTHGDEFDGLRPNYLRYVDSRTRGYKPTMLVRGNKSYGYPIRYVDGLKTHGFLNSLLVTVDYEFTF